MSPVGYNVYFDFQYELYRTLNLITFPSIYPSHIPASTHRQIRKLDQVSSSTWIIDSSNNRQTNQPVKPKKRGRIITQQTRDRIMMICAYVPRAAENPLIHTQKYSYKYTINNGSLVSFEISRKYYMLWCMLCRRRYTTGCSRRWAFMGW